MSRPEEVHLNRGVIYADCLRQEAAAEHELRQALALNPAYLPALQNLANLHEDLGRRGEALATYERILELDSQALEPLARYAQLAATSDESLVARLRAAIAHPSASPPIRRASDLPWRACSTRAASTPWALQRPQRPITPAAQAWSPARATIAPRTNTSSMQ